MITCPACNSTSVINARRFSISASDAAQHFVLAQADAQQHVKLVKHIEHLWSGAECEMLHCATCQLGFAHPFVAGDAEFYNLAAHADYPAEKWEFHQTLQSLKHIETASKNVLEIGSGYGSFLNLVSPAHFEKNHVVAIEYNAAARQRLINSGYSVESADVRSDAFLKYQSTFDFIFMFQVLEHMDNLDELGKRLQLITSKDAHIFIAVPNPHRILFNESHRSLLDTPPNHISLWSRTALEYFGRKSGFRVTEFKTEPMSWKRFIAQDIVYSHMRRAHRSGTIANRLRSRPRTQTRRLAEAALAVAWIPARIPHWLVATKSPNPLGGSIWVHLERNSC